MWFVILLSVSVSLLYYLLTKPYKYWKDKGVTFVKAYPFIGNFGNLIWRQTFADVVDDLYHLYPNERYVGIYRFFKPILLLRDTELIKKIAIKEIETFPDHTPLVTNDVDPLWGRNLFSIKGFHEWQDMRAVVSPSFTSSKMKMMFGLMKNCSQKFIKHFEKQGGAETLDIKDAFTRYTNDVIFSTAFGVTCDSLENRDNEFYLMGKEASVFTGPRGLRVLLGSLSPTLMKMFNIGIYSRAVSKFFRKLIKDSLKLREEKGIVRPDLIHLMMKARQNRLRDEDCTDTVVDSGFVREAELGRTSKQRKKEISDDDITAQSLILFIAGFDTSSTFMSFTSYELAVHPEAQEKLRREVDQVFEECNGELTYGALLGMKYLDMVVSETLRKWPPAIVGDRVSVKPFTIEPELPGEKPLHLKKGSNLWIPLYSLQRDPNHFPEPDKFDPERFNDENKQNIKPLTYAPFGIGPRSCIGTRFALLEGKLIIAEILRKFEIVPVAKTPIPLILETGNFFLKPVGGFWLGLKPRKSVT